MARLANGKDCTYDSCPDNVKENFWTPELRQRLDAYIDEQWAEVGQHLSQEEILSMALDTLEEA